MLFNLKNLFTGKTLTFTVSKAQRELLELLMINKADYEQWAGRQTASKIRFQFFYPTAMDFYYDQFKLFTAFFKKNHKEEIALQEIKMTETNYDTIRCSSWLPFEEVILDFLTTLEESKKIALFEKRKTLFEYQSLCAKNATAHQPENAYTQAVSALQIAKPLQ